MTQYYILVNHDKNERITTTTMSGSGDGPALMSMLQNGLTGRMLILLLTNTSNINLGHDSDDGDFKAYTNKVMPYLGRWCKDDIELIGDYNENYRGLWPFNHYTDITKDMRIAMYSLNIQAFIDHRTLKHLSDQYIFDEYILPVR
jgi:hypothetical protein